MRGSVEERRGREGERERRKQRESEERKGRERKEPKVEMIMPHQKFPFPFDI